MQKKHFWQYTTLHSTLLYSIKFCVIYLISPTSGNVSDGHSDIGEEGPKEGAAKNEGLENDNSDDEKK